MNLKTTLAVIMTGTASLACAIEEEPIAVFPPLTPMSTQLVAAVTNSNKPVKEPKLKHWMVELKAAYFFPQDPLFRDIYNDGGFLPLAEIGYFINKAVCVSIEGGYFHKHGMIDNVHISTTLDQVPVSLLLRYVFFAEEKFNFYAKLGPNYLYSHEEIHYPGFQSKTRHTVGATAGIGFLYNFCHGWFLDLFGNYRYDRRNSGNTDIDESTYLGGFDLGLGLGYRF